MAKFKPTGLINLTKENVRLTEKSDAIELTVKRADEINKVFKEKYPELARDKDILVRVEEK
ncbi:hypothetical protein MUA48_07930 [Staphylococcus sp. IVB6238]|uniref:hypothetical protein n=1 Tax=Staphylococcus sp. IVB6238 TaxID=2989770 RepID=UPI0021CFD935|nr:hypothetical protein [Staphylococcus sp. IVB6238]UXR73302.1 hypothetical protein MUA48_07930 [Staphylococcus sp. IVB6238]